jgi:hypothetical protein
MNLMKFGQKVSKYEHKTYYLRLTKLETNVGINSYDTHLFHA